MTQPSAEPGEGDEGPTEARPIYGLRPFGNYVGPIPVFSGQYQAKLKELFVKTKAPPISFGVGYRWRLTQSHILHAVRKDLKAEAR